MLKKKIIIFLIFLIVLIGIIIFFKIPEKFMKIIYPINYENYVEQYSKQYNVDKYLIYAIIKAESNFNENAESAKGAKGLMQLMENTAKDIIKKDEEFKSIEENISSKLLEPQINIALGVKYISNLMEKYKNVELSLVAYNAGSGNVDKWINEGIIEEDGSNIEKVPYKETNNYVRKILRDYEIYKELYKT